MSSSDQLGPFFDGVFKASGYVGVVKGHRHYRAQIEDISPKSCKVRYLDSPFWLSNSETIKLRSRIKEWKTDSWLPLLFNDLQILSDDLAKMIAFLAGSTKEEFNFIQCEPQATSTTLKLNKFQLLIVNKALELQLL